jgi:hypothetical protein
MLIPTKTRVGSSFVVAPSREALSRVEQQLRKPMIAFTIKKYRRRTVREIGPGCSQAARIIGACQEAGIISSLCG